MFVVDQDDDSSSIPGVSGEAGTSAAAADDLAEPAAVGPVAARWPE